MTMFVLWKLWYGWTTKRLLKKYNPEKDLAKLGEEKRLGEIKKGKLIIHDGKTKEGGEECEAVAGREQTVTSAVEDSVGQGEPEGQELLSAAEINVDGKTSTSNRKNGLGIRKLLRRNRRK